MRKVYPIVKWPRIQAATIRRLKKGGFTNKQIMSEYPTLTVKDIKAAILHGKKKSVKGN